MEHTLEKSLHDLKIYEDANTSPVLFHETTATDHDSTDEDTEGCILPAVEYPGENPMLWTCTICDRTENIFAREDHLLSRSHLTALKNNSVHEMPTTALGPSVPIEDGGGVSLFQRTDYAATGEHPNVIQDDDFADLGITGETKGAVSEADPRTGPPTFELLNTFYCITCRAELPIEKQPDHLQDPATCNVCGMRIHTDFMEHHLSSHPNCASCGMLFHTGDQKQPSKPICQACCTVADINPNRSILSTVANRSFLSMPVINSTHQSADIKTIRAPPSSMLEYCFYVPPVPVAFEVVETAINLVGTRAEPATPEGPVPDETLKRVVPPGSFYCELCNEVKKLVGKEGHESGKKHLDKLAKQNGRGTIAAAVEQPVATQAPSAATGQFYCTVCKKNVDNEAAHILTVAHDRLASKLPGYKPLPGRFFCAVCEKSCDLSKKKKHHRAPAWMCDVCGITMHSDVKRVHLAGAKHMSNLGRK